MAPAPRWIPTSGKNLAYALGTLALIVAIQRIFRGFMATVAVLIGLVVGTLVAWILGDAHFDAVAGSALVRPHDAVPLRLARSSRSPRSSR